MTLSVVDPTTPEPRAGVEQTLGLGEWAVSADPSATLTCIGLGSCVAFIVYDPATKVGGMAHMVLPDSTGARNTPGTAKFVDMAIPLVIEGVEALGAQTRRLRIVLAGGATMLRGAAFEGRINIGDRNADAARSLLTARHLRIAAEDLGGTQGRTVRLRLVDGSISVSLAGQPARLL
ncbi:MAG: chemotaxis protein CheD [Dehalococcoidia bacterium]